MGTGDVVADLAATALFGPASAATLQRLAGRVTVRALAPGEVLVTEGQPTGALFVVRSGRLRVLVGSPHGDELVLSLLGPGDVLGVLSVIDGQPRSATVEAVDRVQLLALPAAEVRAVLLAEPALLLAAATELAGTVRRLTGSAADLVFLDLPRRLAKLLLAEARTAPDGRLVVRLGMSQSALAARLGVTRQTLNRALSGLVRRGWLHQAGDVLLVPDPDELRRFAGS